MLLTSKVQTSNARKKKKNLSENFRNMDLLSSNYPKLVFVYGHVILLGLLKLQK